MAAVFLFACEQWVVVQGSSDALSTHVLDACARASRARGRWEGGQGKEHRCNWVNDKPSDGNMPKEDVPPPGHDGRDRPAPAPNAGSQLRRAVY